MDLNSVYDVIAQVFQFTLFEINQTPVTLASILMFILFISLFFVGSRLLNRVLSRNILPRFQLEENTRFLMLRITHYLIMITGLVVSFQFVGIDLSGLAVIFGLLSVGIGFGLQNVTANFVAGLILLFERPIRIGDRVTVGNTEGDVRAINFRSTTIQSLNNITIIVPNSEFIANQVINWSHGDPKIRLDIEVGVSYNSDLDLVLKALIEVAEEHKKILKKPEPDVLLQSFGDSAWNMILRVWIAHPRKHHKIRSEIHCEIVKKFRQYKIEIPFPQRDLHLRSGNAVPFETATGGKN